MSKIYLFLASFLTLGATVSSAQFLDVVSGTLPPYNVPTELIRDHLTGLGIEILDVQFDGSPKAVGYFTGGDAAIGLHRGLIMTTGRAASETAVNGAEKTGSVFASNTNGVTVSEPLLESLSTGNLNDVVRFRITFRASSDSIRFRYVFASEEYPEYSCSTFNDIFGFFLEGPGYPVPVNIALVPGTNLPVAINNIHPFNNQNNPTPDPCFPFNDQYYHNNLNSLNQPVYDGYLDVFSAEAAVVPCGVYVMTLALGDVSDSAFDSAVFFEANSLNGAADIAASFGPGEAVLPENATADTVSLTFTAIPQGLLPLTVTIGGTAQNGVDYLAIDTVLTVNNTNEVLQFLIQPVSDTINELTETITFTVRDSGCFYRVFTIFLSDPDSLFTPVDSLSFHGTLGLNAPSPTALNNVEWTTSNNTSLVIGPPLNMVYSDLNVQAGGKPAVPGGTNNFSLSTLDDISLLESVCINVEHTWVSDLSIYLFAPNGQFLELTSKNGANGDNYTNTCFSPAATESITYGMPFAPASAAPFTGAFQPEGDWSDLLGAPLNGVWRLGLIDNLNNFEGQLLDWSLSFSGAAMGNFQYLWSTGDTTKSIEVNDPGLYAVTVSNAISSFSKTYVVQLPTSSVNAEPLTDQEIYFAPNPSTGETLISWSNDVSFTLIRAFDMTGRLAFSENVAGAERIRLKTAGWNSGWYIVELEGDNGSLAKGRLLVKH